MTDDTQDRPKADSKADEKVLSELRERIGTARENWADDQRNDMLEDARFILGGENQWTDNARKQRADRPTLTVNKTAASVRQVVNDFKQNRVSISVTAGDDEADEDTAEVIQGMIRYIESQSSADVAYDTAIEHTTTLGLGYLWVRTDYESDDSFDQVVQIHPVHEPLSVYFDPNSQMPDGSDAEWCAVGTWYSEAEFKSRWPNTELSSFEDVGDVHWRDAARVRVVDYFRIVNKRAKLHRLDSGKTFWEGDKQPKGAKVTETRDSQKLTVEWYQCVSDKILETFDWAGSKLPIVPVYGETKWIDGKRHIRGMVRDMKDPARLYNYNISGMVEHVLKSPKAPYIADARTIEPYIKIWDSANRVDHAYLPYVTQETETGQPLPPPQPTQQHPVPQGLAHLAMQASDDIKAVSGIYDASLGRQSNETSGRAILARQQQGATSNFHFVDNLRRSLRQVGRVIIDLLPKIYDTPRMVRILGDDDSNKLVKVNAPTDPLKKNKEQEGSKATYDLTVGKYDVIVSSGPAYATLRQQGAEAMMQMLQANPSLTPIIGDLFMRALDWPGADKAADRLKKMLPPPLQEDNPDNQQNPEAAQAAQMQAAQMQQIQAQMQQMQAKLAEAQKAAEDKEADRQLKRELAERDAQLKLQLAELNNASRLDNTELAQAGALLRSGVQPPDEWAETGEDDPNREMIEVEVPDDSIEGETVEPAPVPIDPAQAMPFEPEPPPDQMMAQDPPSAGFLLPDNSEEPV